MGLKRTLSGKAINAVAVVSREFAFSLFSPTSGPLRASANHYRFSLRRIVVMDRLGFEP